MKNKIIILSGDPNSINSEIIYKSLKTLNKSIKKKIYLISNYKLISEQFLKLKYSIKLTQVNDIHTETDNDNLKVINITLNFKNPFSVSRRNASKFVLKSLEYAHNLALDGKVKGIINCAINKNLLGKSQIGVTEYLSKKCKIKKDSEVMLIQNKKLSVSPVTTHIDIKNISKKIDKKIIINKIKTIDKWYKKQYNKKPKIGILGLNPHNAELRKNSEEKKIIIPAISKLKNLNINIKGPLVSDTTFIEEYKKYDVVVGMFHDQVISPFKTLFKFDAINMTLGLKYIRVSPDHGTGVNLIGKKKANPISLINCIHFLNKCNK